MIDADPAFLAFLQSEESRSYDAGLLEEVEAAINSYNGAEYGDEEDGRSQVVARDVSETVDYMLTSILEAMAASGRIVEFEPNDEADEDVADDATEAMHYMYRRKQGYRLLHDWAKAGLIEKIGVVKTCVERKKKRVEGIMDVLNMPEDPGAAGIIEAQPVDGMVDENGEPTHFHVATLQETAATFPDYYVPLEEFRIAPDARDFDSAVYLAHLPTKRISELTEMGFDVSGLDLSQGGNAHLSTLGMARDDGRNNWYGVLDRDGVNRSVVLNEEYVLYDLNGDGIAERLCVHRVGNTVLAIEPVDYQPFEFWCPYPMQGRLIGQSLADKTNDIQRVNTVLERSMLDSLYMQLAPGTYVDENFIGDHTIDDILTVRPGRIIRTKGGYPQPERRQDVSGFALQAIEFKIRQRESRTGITRLNKGVDEDTLNDTAKGQAQLMSRGQQMERYIIRSFAEGVARLFMKKVGLMRREGQPFRIRVDGAYREVDPSQWPEDMEVNVRVGLGSGSKEDRIVARQMIGQAQIMMKQSGSPLVSDDNLYNNATGLARDMGLQPNDLFTAPPKDAQGNPVPQQQPPDPKMLQAQAELQMKQQQIQQAQQEGQAKLAMMAQKNASDAQIAQARAEFEATMAVRQQNLEAWLQTQQAQMEHEKHVQGIVQSAAEHNAKITKLRSGGRLDR